ncbi:MAG: hypothetical protein JW876_01065 [Candidatus Krumholzibacteriota bacterium]|nr:hypothetical protein [Candidatus Krumholzibacteriota bacterium]
MKRIFAIAVVCILLAAGATAQTPLGYMGLYADGAHGTWCATGSGFYPVEMWIWCLAGINGQICAEFMIGYPANVITSTVTANTDAISVTLGDLASGMSACLKECNESWLWFFHQTLYVSDPTLTFVQILGHPDVGVYQFANCNEGFPTEPCVALTHLYLNAGPELPECQTTAVETASWGAIKSMLE